METILIICGVLSIGMFIIQILNHKTGRLRPEEICIFAIMNSAIVNINIERYFMAIIIFLISSLYSFIIIRQDRKVRKK